MYSQYQFLGKKRFGNIIICPQSQPKQTVIVLVPGGETISLTAKELLLLKKLNQNRGKIVTFDAICQAVWEDSYYGYENTLMVHIRHLREKIEENPSNPVWIQTVRGLGYRLKKEEKQG